MKRTRIERSSTAGTIRTISIGRRCARFLGAALVLAAVTPWPAQAQFGMLKKLKNAVSQPDSSARAKDSLAQIAAGVSPDSVKIGKGLLARGMTAAGDVSDKMEKATGISAKDAALAATGVGAGGLLAKKMGVDPMSLGKAAMANAKQAGQQRAMNATAGLVGLPKGAGMGAIPGMPDLAKLQAMQGAAGMMQGAMAKAAQGRMKSAVTPNGAAMMGPGAGLAGFTQADAEALVAFQQEMMQVAMAASAGDASAKARLDAWQALTLKHQPEIEKLSLQAQGGDMTAIQKLQMMQFTIIREWASTGSRLPKILKSTKP
jgi:hypothetical protein